MHFYGHDRYAYDEPGLAFTVTYRVFEPETGAGIVVITSLTSKS